MALRPKGLTVIQFLATINVPGYSPMDDDPPLFDTPREAWGYLLDDREIGEEFNEDDEYSATHAHLARLANGSTKPLDTINLDALLCGSVTGDTPGSESLQDLGLAYSVTLVVTNPTAAEVWPHVKPRLVTLGKGRRQHGTLGAVTGCGRAWSGETIEADSYSANIIDCQRCLTAIDQRNTWNRKISYGANVSFEQDAFASGAGLEATEWRVNHYGREIIADVARRQVRLLPTTPARGRNR